MKKMVKGFAFVALLSASVVLTGCGNKSKFERLIDEMHDAKIEAVERVFERQKEKALEEFEKMSESEQDEELKELEEMVKEIKDKVKEAEKDPKNALEYLGNFARGFR